MKTFPARWIAPVSIILALLVVYSCSDDSTTCPPLTCSYPAKALYGTWITFYATINGSPAAGYDSMRFHFSDNDTMLVTHPGGSSMRYLWSANDSTIFFELTPNPTEILVLGYMIKKDTLDLWDRMNNIDVTFRMLKED